METRLSRRILVRGLVSTSVMYGVAQAPMASLAAQSTDVSSGGIGLSRPAWEGVYGTGTAGQSFQVYGDPYTGADMHVGFDTTHSADGVLDYLYVSIATAPTDDGIPVTDALDLIQAMLPGDASLETTFVRNETPGSLMGVTTQVWSSAGLGNITANRSAILVQYTEGPAGVTTVIINVQEPG